ncbi:hypothetical protein HWV62_32662 [Athelia sp. TMB]|nr:hypothetical protein HWV62_32662 [Athelia sp. TMB]
MSAPSNPRSRGPPATGEASGSQQPPISKAEQSRQRRAIQEQQRAAKAQAQTAAKVTGSALAKPGTKSGAAPQTPKKGGPAGASKQPTKDIAGTAGDDGLDKSRGLRIFSHFGLPKSATHVVKGDIHPAIVRLALQFSEFKISGANARCIATLTAFKTVIQDYVTPPNNTLSRHLMTHLSPQITHLVAARPMSVTMGNAIRQLKLEISDSDIDLPEQDAKDLLCEKIDHYIRDRIIIADQVIEDIAVKKIKDGDVILTYARSSVVEKILRGAHSDGRRFSVLVVDSRPMLEGKKLLSVLSSEGIQCTYLLLPAIGSVINEVSTVFVGAHSLHSNGAVYSRSGTALVAMMAKQHSVPVVVCCETYKYSDSVQLDSFTKNEIAPSGDFFSSYPLTQPRETLSLQNQPNLEILNPLYDLTPPTSITAVVTEVGVIPPSSISSIPFALGRQNL